MLHLPSTPGGKIKQHTVHNELPSGAILMNDNMLGTNLAERMATLESSNPMKLKGHIQEMEKETITTLWKKTTMTIP